MELNSNQKFQVGAFIAVGAFILMTTIVLLGGDQKLFTSYYTLYVDLEQVQGIDNGSVVSLAGMKVGNVREIHFVTKNNVLRVELSIDETYQPRITKGALAEIRTKGALGDKFIYINPGPLSAPPLQDGDTIDAETGGDLLGIIADNSDNVERLFEVFKEIDILLKSINHQGKIPRLMSNLLETTSHLTSSLQSTQILIEDLHKQSLGDERLKKSLTHLSNILEKVDKGQGTLGALINDPAIHDKLKSMLGGSKRSKYMRSLMQTTIIKSEEVSQEKN